MIIVSKICIMWVSIFLLESILRFFRRSAQSLSNHNLCFFGFFLGHATLRDRKHVSVIILVNCSVARSIPLQSEAKFVFSNFDIRKRTSSCFKALRKFSKDD